MSHAGGKCRGGGGGGGAGKSHSTIMRRLFQLHKPTAAKMPIDCNLAFLYF